MQNITSASILGIVFVILKLTNVIDWSWWWVTAPFWAPAAIGIVLVLCIAIFNAVRE